MKREEVLTNLTFLRKKDTVKGDREKAASQMKSIWKVCLTSQGQKVFQEEGHQESAASLALKGKVGDDLDKNISLDLWACKSDWRELKREWGELLIKYIYLHTLPKHY